jgi:thiol-disulfide isomerase/thioredoxin
MNLQAAADVGLAMVLLTGALAKLAAPARSAAALATFGVRARGVALAVLVVTELGLAVGVADGRAAAAYAAAGLMAGFGLALAVVLRRGGAGAPCGCFGARGTVSAAAVARNAVLAAAFAGLPSIPPAAVSTVGWLAAGVGLALCGLVAAGVAILALARELGELRLRLGPQLALELEDEGPPLGERVLSGRFERSGDAGLVLAVFSSDGCPLCRALEPSLAWLASDPFVSMMSFDEHADADVWLALGVPGSPYAVVLDPVGTVLAKGAFNNAGQLEGMLASGERRAEAAHAGR